jgi:hypothetical protein
MKIRQGFVSNSSSSSFTCDVCGEECSGMDMGLNEAEMMECVNGHCFCTGHAAKTEDADENDKMREYLLRYADDDADKEEIKALDDDDLYDRAYDEGYGEDDCYDVSASICPICSFLEYQDFEACKYLMKKIGLSKEAMLADMKKEFADYDKLQEFISEKKDEN